ncbi:hypothetical protein KAS79_04080 [Candidatus Parcubacteria bacterium]|nr:hypothetical protein [Candidatus Parcubacteria bacterium]
MKNPKYIFQKRKISFTKRLFEQGLNAGSYILFGIKDLGEDFTKGFIGELPDCYPGFKLMKDMFGCSSEKKFKKEIIRVNISRLKKQGLIKQTKNKKLLLTDKGKEMIIYIKDRYSILNKPWDEKIRVVVFDIPEKRRRFREWFRAELSLLMFKPLQKSTYIGKYPIPDDLYQDLIDNNLFQDIHIFTIDKADKEEKLLELLKE